MPRSALGLHVDQVIADSVRENVVLLDYPNAETVKCGTARGRMGDTGVFTRSAELADIWKPRAGHRGRDESAWGEIELTRCCALTFACPAAVVHEVWFRKHFLRHRWDTRTVADSRPLDQPPSLNIGGDDDACMRLTMMKTK